MTNLERYLPFLFPIVFIALWTFILGIFSLVSGWRRLAGRYSYPEEFQGEFIRFQSARMNWVNLRNILHLGINRQGLYLTQMVLFRLFHKPILIPWEDIIAVPHKRLLYQGYQLQFRSVPGVRLELYRSTFQRLLHYLEDYPGNLRLDREDSDWK